MPARKVLGILVRARRIEKGWTQRGLAKVSGVSHRRISTFEAGGNVTLDVVDKLAAALELGEIGFGQDARGLDVAAVLEAVRRAAEELDTISDTVLASQLTRRPGGNVSSEAVERFVAQAVQPDPEAEKRTKRALRRLRTDEGPAARPTPPASAGEAPDAAKGRRRK